jgi:hypothetical protein
MIPRTFRQTVHPNRWDFLESRLTATPSDSVERRKSRPSQADPFRLGKKLAVGLLRMRLYLRFGRPGFFGSGNGASTF